MQADMLLRGAALVLSVFVEESNTAGNKVACHANLLERLRTGCARMTAAPEIQCGIPRRLDFAHDQARSLPSRRTAHRSTSSKIPCVNSASTAAGIAPASSMSLSFSARPMVMRSP